MKKIILIHAVFCMCTASNINKTFCQTFTGIARLNPGIDETVTPEHNSAMPVNTATDYRNAISIKAVRKFLKDFKDVTDVTWSKASDGGYIAEFINDSIKTMVAYTRHGSWSYTLKTYAEKKMPANVRTIVKSTFFDYVIKTVTEIKLPQEKENIIYRVLIKNGDNCKILRVCNKEMEIASDFTKP
jgi:hypothetical protein